MTADMSTSLKVVSIAAVCCASTSRRAIVWRRLRHADAFFWCDERFGCDPGRSLSVRRLCCLSVRRCCRCESRSSVRRFDVCFVDATRRRRSLERCQVDVVVLRHAPRRGGRGASLRRFRPIRCRSTPVLLLVPVAGGCGCRAAFVDDGEQFADLDVLAFLAGDAGDDAALLGADLEVDLLGLELDDRLADFDAVARLLQPPRDARFDDRFTQLWNDDIRHFPRNSLVSVMLGKAQPSEGSILYGPWDAEPPNTSERCRRSALRRGQAANGFGEDGGPATPRLSSVKASSTSFRWLIWCHAADPSDGLALRTRPM